MDDTVKRIMESFRLHCRGERAEARERMTALWEELGEAGNPYHRSVLAHFMADMQHEPDEELRWDRLALDVAEAGIAARQEGDPVAGALTTFLPSLHLNVADGYRRQGDFERAQRHVEEGLVHARSLTGDTYGQTVWAGLIRVQAQVEERDRGPSMIFDFD